jgi:hypothetical protein
VDNRYSRYTGFVPSDSPFSNARQMLPCCS